MDEYLVTLSREELYALAKSFNLETNERMNSYQLIALITMMNVSLNAIISEVERMTENSIFVFGR